ncbi:chlorophyllide reductase [Bradyrhizobium uaiense]|uniref:Chlorophyllide reductase n=1 Tax=Bradyrhizobium uaiense TaxID=2594946 RepID=A0A6P1BG49_9BRAD|nr:chlorophyllide reductase [Bradyrhizobium uaiense]NEU96610.1 chlorophyllide reductase [Bradyrhizobium uaiense]
MLNRPTRAICALLVLTTAAHAQPSTSRGQISVAQVRAMLDQAATNPTARQTLTAYLAGTGEAAGWLLDAARSRPPCPRQLTLDAEQARDAIASAAATAATETPATPLIVRDMLKRAGCHLTE